VSRAVGVVLAAACVLQVVLGASLALAPFIELPGDAAAGLLYDGVAPGRSGLERLVETRSSSVALAARPGAHRDLAMAYLLEAERSPDAGEARRFAAAAEAEFLAAARLAPADPTVWAMVPFAALRQERFERAAELLRTGLQVVPYAPDYALNRLAVLVALEGGLDPELEGALDRVLADAARHDLEATARYLVERGVAEALLPRVTADPELAHELARAVERAAEAGG
jgi:hypothetical protein